MLHQILQASENYHHHYSKRLFFKGCKKIMGIDLQSTQLRRNKRSHENKELNKELSTANPRILLDSTTFLHWIR